MCFTFVFLLVEDDVDRERRERRERREKNEDEVSLI